MRESDPGRKSTFDLLLGERKVRRSKRRWIEEVQRELKGVSVKYRKRMALERDKWKKIVEESKA
jgi:flagellar motor switch protein FliM